MPELVNAVGGGSVDREFDLAVLSTSMKDTGYSDVRYDPEYWHGLYIRENQTSPAIMVFQTGKFNIAGADSIENLFEAKDEFLSDITDLGIKYQNTTFEIRNLVFLDRYEREFDLNQLAIGLGLEQTEYEPEQFPGLLYSPSEVTGTFLIFRNGKIILTGANDKDNAISDFESLFEKLDKLFK